MIYIDIILYTRGMSAAGESAANACAAELLRRLGLWISAGEGGYLRQRVMSWVNGLMLTSFHWESYRKTIGKWENHRKSIGKWWVVHGISWDLLM